MRVTTRWADGTTLHGWVKRDELAEAGVHHERLGDDAPRSAARPAAACDPPRIGANERIVAAPVTAGTQVFARALSRRRGPRSSTARKLQLRVRAEGRLGRDRERAPASPARSTTRGFRAAAAKLPTDARVE